jgi:hypothetical protein
MLCADLVIVEWQTKPGRIKTAVANLEDIGPARMLPPNGVLRPCGFPRENPFRKRFHGRHNPLLHIPRNRILPRCAVR